MSVLGTGIAAGVSQTSLQAQQVARDRDRKRVQDDENARLVRERFEAHLRSPEDPEQVEPVDRLRVDKHPPQNASSDPQPQLSSVQPDSGSGEPTAGPAPLPATPADHEGPLYHHLDVKG